MIACDTCADRRLNGRKDGAPIHCGDCHQTWTGNEAQHCTKCHRTFSTIAVADAHRFYKVDGVVVDRCIDPSVTEGWREKRPGVWTNSEQWAGLS